MAGRAGNAKHVVTQHTASVITALHSEDLLKD